MKFYEFLIYLLLFICGGVIGFFLRRRANIEIDEQSQAQNKRLNEENLKLDRLIAEKKYTYASEIQQLQEFQNEKKKELLTLLKEEEDSKRQEISEKISLELQLEREKLKQKIAEISQNEFSQLSIQLEENRLNFEAKTAKWNSELETLSKEIEELRNKKRALIEAAKHEEEIAQQKNFYRLQVEDDVIEDVMELKKLQNRLHNPDVLNKLIYKTYFEKPYTSLIGRVVGADKVTGIYKITNINDQRVYIGQAVDIAARWKQHIKRALGAEPITQNKLYPAMEKEGVWNFTFEIVEKCKKEELGEREQYYQEFFGAKEYGYSIK